VRGRVDVVINGSFWIGTTVAAALSIPILNGDLIAENVGWRAMSALGAALMIAAGIVELFLGVEAARRSLEDVARPLPAEERPRTATA
jgi:hypothetical protein